MKRFNCKIFILALLIAFGGLFFVSASLAAAQGPDFSKVPIDVQQHLAQLRAEIKKKNYRFTVGYNPAMEYSIEKLCGLKSPPEWKEIAGQNKTSRNVLRDFGDLPGSFDWRALGGVTSVKSQGSCGSCWAFGTVVPIESAIKIFLGQTVNLSEQYLVSCNEDDWGCDGGWWAHDYHQWRVPSGETEAGAVYESDFPYTATDAPCNPPHPHAFVLNSWSFVPGGSYWGSPGVADIKQAIYTYGPVSAALAVGSYFHAYTGGVFNKDEAYGDSNNINHAIGLVGWNDDYYGDGSNVGVWILKNSWGSWWGDDGFMYITYGTSMVGYAATYVELDAASAPTVDLETPSSPQSKDIDIQYTLFDNDSDLCNIIVEYSYDSGETYFNATSGPGGDGAENLNSSPDGISHIYVWDSLSDLGYNYHDDVRIRITPNDGETGTSDTTQGFIVDNTDTDEDGLPDLWEISYFGNLDQGPVEDDDDDGLNNLGEYENNADPTDWDTDDDTYSDGDEVNYYETDPNNTNDYPQPPTQPSITTPPDQATNISTNPDITSTAFNDPNQGAAEDLVAQWQFEGNALDETDNGNDGTVHEPSYLAGRAGQALEFDGVSDYVEIPNSSSLNITNNITIETWIYPHSIDSAGLWDRIAEKGANNQYGLSITQKRGIVFRLYIGGLQTYYSQWIPPVNEWTHIVATYDQSYVRIYANGSEIYSSIQTGNIVSTTHNLYIGNWGGSGERPFDGVIDEVAIYSRALSDTEIEEHYQKGLNNQHNPASSGDTHGSSDWEVYEDIGFTQLVWSSYNDTTNLISTTVNTTNGTFTGSLTVWERLKMDTDYWVTVRHTDNRGADSDWSEVSGFRTQETDTDGDGFNDDGDTDDDDDGLLDTDETNTGVYVDENHTGTDPLVADTDGDGVNDGDEVDAGTDPTDDQDYPNSPPTQPSITTPPDQATNISTNPDITSTAFNDPNQGAAEDLVAQWQFEGNALDETDNGNDGTVHEPSYLAGRAGQALEFDGVSDYVEIPNSSSLNITNNITIETWIYPHSIDSAGLWDRIAEKGANNQYGLSITQKRGIVFRLYIGGLQTYYSQWIPPVNEWTHIVATYDQSYVRIYANGSEIYSSIQTGNIVSTTHNLYIGNWGGSGERPFDGVIDEVAIYSRALSDTEIEEHYQKGLNNQHNPASSGDTHGSSDWEVYEDIGFTQLVWSSYNDTTNLISTTVNTTNGTFTGSLTVWERLKMDTDYWVTVRHTDNRGADSDWSEVSGFRTSSVVGADSNYKWTLWSGGTQLRGANIYQRRVYPELDGPTFMGSGPAGPPYTQEDFNRLASMGANYVNISHPGLYTETPPYVLDEDIQENLDNLLAMITQADMFAVISFRTGPGRSEFTFFWDEAGDWFDESYLNDSLWQDQEAQNAWASMWRYAAERYKNNPIVVGYDLMVEPNSNEVGDDAINHPLDIWDPEEFYANHGNTLYNWNQLYPRISSAIREVDADTPVLIGGNGYSDVDWLPYIEPTGDPYTVYAVHQYDPYLYTHQDPYSEDCYYPGTCDTDWDGEPDTFDRAWLEDLLATIDEFRDEHNVSVAVNEFGIMRWEPGAADFMDDQMGLFEQKGVNYALWLWETSWEEYAQEVDAFNFRHGPDPDNHTDVLSSDLMEVISKYWGFNTVRPSSVGFGGQ